MKVCGVNSQLQDLFIVSSERRDASRCLYRSTVSDLQTKFSIKSDEGLVSEKFR